MPFDMNQLFENPGFVFGASLLGSARQPNAVGNAFGIAQKINQFKQQRDYQNSQLGIEGRNATTAERAQQSTENYQKAEGDFKRQQMTLAMQKYLQGQALMQAFSKRFNIPMGQVPNILGQMGMQQPMDGAQGANAMNNPLPGSNLNSPPIGTMPGENPNGMAGGAQMQPSLPVPQGVASPQPMGAYPPDMMDPSGPFTGKAPGAFGAPQPFSGQPAPQGRPLQRTSLDAVKRAILQQESGGRANAPTSIDGAVGPGQMLPATFQRFAPPGANINDPRANVAASSRYLDYLAAKAAGDPAKMAAGYFSGEGNIGQGPQPFKRNVVDGNGKSVASYVDDIMRRLGPNAPTGYTQRVLAGYDQPPAQASGIQGPPMQGRSDATDMALFGAAMGLGEIPGAEGISKAAEAMQPKTIPAGSYMQGPDGSMTFVGSPYEERKLGYEGQRVGLDTARLGIERQGMNLKQREADYNMGTGGNGAGGGLGALPPKVANEIQAKRFDEANASIEKSYETNKALPQQIIGVNRALADVNEMIRTRGATTPIGTAADWKKTLVKTFTNTFGTAPSPDVVNAEDFDAAMSQAWMKAVKAVDQNPTERQMNSIKAAFGQRSNDPHALAAILAATKESMIRTASQHNASVQQFERVAGPDPFSRYLPIPQDDQVPASQRGAPAPAKPAPAAPPAKGGIQFLGFE